MTIKTPRQFGLWDSPITPRSLAEDRRLDAVRYDSDGRSLIWLEGRSGQGVLVTQQSGVNNGADAANSGANNPARLSFPLDAPRDLTSDLSVRGEVGYGGGDFTAHGGHVYFAVHETGRIFRQPLAGGRARPITPPFGQSASPTVSPDGKWLAYVHHDDDDKDRLAVGDAEGRCWPQILTGGHDFYMQPRWSPDGRRLAWIAWDHPHMPWDGTTLFVADVLGSDALGADVLGTEGVLPRLGGAIRVVAGGDDVAIFQPEFTPDGRRLLYVSDETGWGRIVLHDLATDERRFLTPDGVEHAAPAWVQDQRTYAVGHDGRALFAVRNERGFHHVVRIDLATGQTAPVAELAEYTDVSDIVAAPNADRIAIVGSHPTRPPRVVEFDVASVEFDVASVEFDVASGRPRVVARASGETVSSSALAPCEAVTWTTAGGEVAHGLFHAPTSDGFKGLGKPPLVVLIHGGPTSQVTAGWRAASQFFATRGYAVLQVNYRGSTGYGRAYMLRLRGNWGLCDVEDAVSGARHLADAGRVDAERTIIMGGSAGGFTVLQTMVDHPDAFAAGVCLYGVADQFHLAAHTHKFEARYTDSLIGPLPEAAALYRQRSPVFHAERIRRPLAVFQGGIDRVVPREQSDMIVETLKRTGTPHVYHVYEDEGHGWRKRETIEHFYAAVDEFLRRHVLFA